MKENKTTVSVVFYYLTVPFLYLLSYLPFRVLYILSNVFYVLVYRLIGYRKQLVTENLHNAFPEKSADEIKQIRSDFYHYLCDVSLETVKTLSISPATLEKHIKLEGMSIYEHFHQQQKSVIIVTGHLGSWELAGNHFSMQLPHQFYGLYHPLTNQYYDRFFIRMRTRFGLKLYPMKNAYRSMIRNRNELTATAFIADQTPTPQNAYWMTFMNQDTAVFKGTETIARKLDYPVIYVSVIREKRGHHVLRSELLVEHPGELAENKLTELHTTRLEQDIIKYPETWLWSHRRWKHKRPD